MSLEFTLVRRAISLAVIDGPDADDNPDILQAQGSVLFEPVIKKGDSIQVQTRGGSETYALAPIECPINDGIISHRGQDGVKLPAGGEAANPSLIRWKATFSRMQAGGKSFTLAPVIFDAVPGGEIDLTMVAPVAGAPEGVVRGPRGTSLESIIVDGSELLFTAVDDAGSFEIARIPLDEMVRAEADAAADGVRDALAVDVAASQAARDAAEGHANRAATSESNAAASETNAKQSEDNAGDYAAVATTAATEAVDAMERATDLAGGDFATHEYVDSQNWVKRNFVSGEDLNEVTDPGLYTMPSYARANTLLNKPTASNAVDRGATEVLAGGGAVQQTWYPMGVVSRTDMPVMRRRRDNAGTWTEWERINAKVDIPDYDPLDAVGMAATGASGELTGLRSVLRGLTPGVAPVWSWWAPAPTEELEMPTHDGGGQTCHPSVLYFPSGWNGWKYWMAHTPYPNFQEAHEDPNIAVSNDGTTWQEPEGLTNPLDDGLGRPNYHNSDAHLAMNGNTMVVTWRTVDRPNGGQNIIYARTSTDGVNWTDKTEVLKVPLGTAESTFVAQSLIKMPTGWRLYGIRSMYGPNRLGYYETSVETLPKTSDWGAAKDCDLGAIPAGRDPWHSEVQRLSANDWVAVISDGRYGSTGVDGDIYLATSTDGVEWDVSPLPLTPRANGVINSLYKTGFVVSGTGTDRTLDLWVSGYRTDKRTWGIYRTLAEYRGSSHAETLPVTRVGTGSPEGKVTAPVGSIYTDSDATNGAIRWIKASGTGTTGWTVEYGSTGARNISSMLTDATGEVTIERIGQVVYLDAKTIKPEETLSSGSTFLESLPTGFRPKSRRDFSINATLSSSTVRSGFQFANGAFGVWLPSTNDNYRISHFWITTNPWPTTLPGTPA